MNHCIITRLKLDDKDLLLKYLDAAEHTLAPGLRSQTAHVDWGIVINHAHEQLVLDRLGIPFVPLYSKSQMIEFASGYELQTRHDIDDWMHRQYCESLQEAYRQHTAEDRSPCVIFHKAIFCDLETGVEREMQADFPTMFTSLAQPDHPRNHVYVEMHVQMGRVVPPGRVYAYGYGMVKWCQHRHSRTQMRAKTI